MGFLRFFTLERQFILFVACLALTVVLQFTLGFAWSWIPLLVVIILTVKHLLLGTVNAAAMKMQFGDFTGAEKLLKYTYKPSWLRMGFEGMYHLTYSRIMFEKKDFTAARNYCNAALEVEDLLDDYKAMTYLQLMAIEGQLDKSPRVKTKIQALLKKTKGLKISQEQIKMELENVKAMLSGQHPQQKQMMGKRAQRSMMAQQGFSRRNGKGKRR